MSKNKFQISAQVEGNVGVIRISGEIERWKNHAEGFRNELKAIKDAGVNDLKIYINSPGGDCAEAGEIVNELIPFNGKKTGVLGVMCASAATYIACHCDHVIAAKNTNYMIHKPWGGAVGNASEIEAQVKLLKNLEKEYADAYANKTGLPVAKIESMWTEDYWMNATEAKTLGFVDEIAGEVDVTEEEINALKAKGFKKMPEIKATVKTENQPTMKKIIAILSSFPGLTIAQDASEDVIAAHVESLKLKAQAHDDIKKKYDDLVVQAMNEKVEAELNIHATAKRFAPASRDFWKKSLIADFAGTKATLDAMPAVSQLSKETRNDGGNGGGEDRSKWTYATYQEKDPKALAEMAKENEEQFRALFKAHYGHDNI